jgi:transcriptional regulator with XRE-family HTH domain
MDAQGTMQRRNGDPTSLPEIGRRLALTRRALGVTQAMMASLMGSSTAGQAWENYEAGRRRISIDHALELHRNCGLTLPWIYEGELKTLAPGLQRDIRNEMVRDNGAGRQLPPTTLKAAGRGG